MRVREARRSSSWARTSARSRSLSTARRAAAPISRSGVERAVVDDQSDRLAVSHDRRRRLTRTRCRVDRPAGRVHVPLRGRQPVGDLEAIVAERAGQRRSERPRRRRRAERVGKQCHALARRARRAERPRRRRRTRSDQRRGPEEEHRREWTSSRGPRPVRRSARRRRRPSPAGSRGRDHDVRHHPPRDPGRPGEPDHADRPRRSWR